MIQFPAAARGVARVLPSPHPTLVIATLLGIMLTASPALPQTFAPAAAGGHYLWISPDEVQALPTTGAAWTNLLRAASASCPTPDLVDQDDKANTCVLAKALVFARTGDAALRAAVASALDAVVVLNANYGGRALALGRELIAYVIAADLIDLQAYDPSLHKAFSDRIRYLRTAATTDGPKNLIECHEKRPNNWGTHCGASRLAVSVYLGDTADVARAAQVFRGWLGDRSSYASFAFGDLAWQFDQAKPVAINPKGALKDGRNIDGVLPDDQRRAGGFSWPPSKENYVYEALQGALAQAVILHRIGYDVFNWEDRALLRAFEWLHNQASFPATGDDTWQPWVVNHYYGTSFPAPLPSQPGKNVGWTDWTHAARGAPPPTSPGKPRVTGASGHAGGTLNVSWSSGAGAAPTAHTLTFYKEGVRVTTAAHGPSTTFTSSLPADAAGDFSVVVTPFAGSTPGPPSDAFTFNVAGGGGGPCAATAAPVLSGQVAGNFASVAWNAVPGAVGYVISVGTTAGSADLLAPLWVGNTLAVGAPVPPGFQAWVRVQAVNACYQPGTAADVFVK